MKEQFINIKSTLRNRTNDETQAGTSSYFLAKSTKYRWLVVKRAMDVVLSSLMIVAAAPMLILIWSSSRMDGGTSLYAHKRVGLNGRVFGCLKFRTMVMDADSVLVAHLKASPEAAAEWSMGQKLTSDPRVTRLGRFLRATSLDELPQLFNVLRGEMSLVGPRPVVLSELDRFYKGGARRTYLSVRPGLTGLWQVSGRSNVSYDQRVALDIKYVAETSFALDIYILWRSVAVVLRGTGAR